MVPDARLTPAPPPPGPALQGAAARTNFPPSCYNVAALAAQDIAEVAAALKQSTREAAAAQRAQQPAPRAAKRSRR